MDKLVFISHNSNDKDIAREIGLFLIAEGISVWFDEWNIDFGNSITKEVENGLSNSTHFLLIWSIHAQCSKWVESEYASQVYAKLSNKKDITIIPILIDDTELPDLVNHCLHIDYTGEIERDRFEIVRAISGNAPTGKFIESIVKKYHEILFSPDADNVFNLRACPRCGSEFLDHSSAYDYDHDEQYYFISCRRCSWADWTQ